MRSLLAVLALALLSACAAPMSPRPDAEAAAQHARWLAEVQAADSRWIATTRTACTLAYPDDRLAAQDCLLEHYARYAKATGLDAPPTPAATPASTVMRCTRYDDTVRCVSY
jgi:hypothetical protein